MWLKHEIAACIVAAAAASFLSFDVQAKDATVVRLVLATADWIDTGIDVKPGDRVDFFASGSWDVGGASYPVGANGYDGVFYPAAFVPSAPLGSLVGRIGVSYFLIGVSSAHEGTGRLYVAMNDSAAGHGDNSGAALVSIELQAKR